MPTIELKLKLPVTVTKEEKHTVAKCSALKIYSVGKNERSAVANLEENISSFLIHCLRVLREKKDPERARPALKNKNEHPKD